MIRRAGLLACLLSLLLLGQAHADPQPRVIVSSKVFQAIQAAMPAFERRGWDPSRYQVLVNLDFVDPDLGPVIFVMFYDGSVPEEELSQYRGSPGRIPALGVLLSRDDLRILEATLQR